MRLGCWLVCFSLVIGLMLPQQKAEALVAELSMAAVASVAAAYLGACGLSFVTQGMDKDALVSSVQRLIQEFLDTELGGVSIQDWLGNVWDLTVIAGKLIMGRPLTEEFVSFAQWVAGKYAANVGVNAVYNDKSYYLADGTKIIMGTASAHNIYADFVFPSDVTQFFVGQYYEMSTGGKFAIIRKDGYLYQYTLTSVGDEFSSQLYNCPSDITYYYLADVLDREDDVLPVYLNGSSYRGFVYGWEFSRCFGVADESLSIDRAENPVYIPEGIKEEQGIALDVGAAATMDLDLVLQGVLKDVLAGKLAATMEAAGEKVEPVDPPAGEITDMDNLGLPALGQALTSRFPFSIPWDFFRAVKLLAAPAKAPYFEVDFMEPLADEVGGWKGSTTIVLDFAEYALIGQISRWTSTIGFCLMLAGVTKRLIWTA